MRFSVNTNEAGEPGDGILRGERAAATVNRAHSIESRVSTVLAVGLVMALGLGMLIWYYTNTMTRQARARHGTQAATNRAQSDTSLPSLGRIDPPEKWLSNAQPPVSDKPNVGDRIPGPASELPLRREPNATSAPGSLPETGGIMPANDGSQPAKTPNQLAVDRRLSGAAFARVSNAPGAEIGAAPSAAAAPVSDAAGAVRVLPTQRLLLAKGAFIDCTLETAIDSTLPGMTTCVIATDTFSVDGKVVLLERGTKLVGETRGQVQQGAARVFVLWTEARTPTGVIIPLASSGTDELGRSGLPGAVNRHFWERFGAAILISTLDGAVQSAVRSSGTGSGALILNPSSSQDIMSEALKSTVNIPPTIVKQHGDRIQVLVARDLDFRPVYELRAVEVRH